jgi:MFS family permease
MKRFRSLNNIFGWVAFAIAALTYLLTMEPTASFWDCPEFISSALKFDVGHPPGAPFHMIVGHFFTLFAKDSAHVAIMMNSLTALCSAFTILFLFWTITHLARKIVIKSDDDYTTRNIIAVIGAGLVGALAYAFSDTFWFSAVEAEVYGFSALFTSLVFWLILKWEDAGDEPGSDRWLIFIAYMMGLSIGVHLLNLLTIPALVMVFYFKKYTPSVKGVLISLVIGVIILATVLYGLIPGFLEVSGWFELLFVNVFGFGFNSGLLAYVVLTFGLLIWAIYETYQNKSHIRIAIAFVLAVTMEGLPFFSGSILLGILIIAALIAFFYFKKGKINPRWLNTTLLMISMILIGFSSYSTIVIRSMANPTMDQNNPDNVFSLKYYLNREQYGETPLLYGPVYNAPVKLRVEGNSCIPEQKQGEPTYALKDKISPSDKDRYIITGYKTDYVMDDRFMMFFPRMYSTTAQHIDAYKSWAHIEGEPVTYDYCGQEKTDIKPTFFENMKFFFNYQLNFMYWRYFMWNFSGRQNDIQGLGEIDHGNWITGIGFIDNLLVGDQTKLPSELKENKGHNTYYLLPLLLGIFGMIYMIYGGKKGVESFWLVFLLFFMTGIAIVVYLNQTPYQPRERDYAYAGSFYAFCIWIGLGVLGIIKVLEKYLPKIPQTVIASVVSICCLGIPALMAQQNWDDHDRSLRYTCRDFGANYLASCKPNAIIFSNGDNDTFPLWYNQEVEGKGTDIRVCNLSYLQTDWYIGQMQRGAYKSEPLPISWQQKDYEAGKNEVLWVNDEYKKPLDINLAFDFILRRNAFKDVKDTGDAYIPSKQLFLPIDAQQVIKSGILPEKRAAEIIPQLNFDLKKRLTKSELMILEMLRENKWKRPIYFAVTVGDEYYLGLNDHFELTGLAYQILPIGVKGAGPGINIDEMYDNMMNKFKYGNISDPKIYLDENTLRMCHTHRMMFSQLIGALMLKGDTVRAAKALDYCNKVIPGTTVRHDYISTQMADYYYKLHQPAKGNAIMTAVAQDCVEYIDWYFSLNAEQQNSVSNRIGHNMAVLNQVLKICDDAKQKSIMDKYMPRFMDYSKRLRM